MEYENYKEFFEKCGDGWVHPTIYGECFCSCTVEEMYQHFKSRMIDELKVRKDHDGYMVNERCKDTSFSLVLDLVEQWQCEGRLGFCLPVIRDDLLDRLEKLVDERRTENCSVCGGNGKLREYDHEWECPQCARPNA